VCEVEPKRLTFATPRPVNVVDRQANRCPVYSGGAARFGFSMAQPVRRDLDL
jgi:hypothetical protein